MSVVEKRYAETLKKLTVTPREHYQDKGIKWMIERELDPCNAGGLLGDEVGLGKTLQTIGLICSNVLESNLILVPKSLIDQWISEFKKFAPSINVIKYESHKDVFDYENCDVVIGSLSLISGRNKKNIFGEENIRTRLHNYTWSRVIIDEAHSIKNKKSKVHKAVCLLDTKIRWLLSATPVMNKMTDFINLMGFLGISQSDCQTKKLAIVDKYILRRTKEDVKKFDKAFELPELDTMVYESEFETCEEMELYREIFLKTKKDIQKMKTNNVIEALEKLLRIRQFCIHPQLYYDGIAKKEQVDPTPYGGNCTKYNSFMQSVQQKPSEEKALVFCQFIKELEIYSNGVNELGQTTLKIYGSMSLDERTKVVKEFNDNSEIKFLFVQINTGGQGYNLQVANWVYILSPCWNPALEHQAIGRSHRSGQQKEVHVVKFVSYGTHEKISYIEQSIIELQNTKKKLISEILNDPRISDEGVKQVRVKKACEDISVSQIKKLFRS